MNTDNATPGTWKLRGTMTSDSPESVGGLKMVANENGDLVAYTMPENAALIAKAKVNAELVNKFKEAAHDVISKWESGDLAGAVRELSDVLTEAQEAAQ